MTADLRPMNLGEILDRTFQIYRAKFLTFAAIAMLPATVIIALNAVNHAWWGLTPAPYDGDVSLALLQWTLYLTALYQVALLLHLLVWPAFTCLTSQLYFGENPTLTAATFRGNAHWRNWLWMAIASWGVVLILPELATAGPAIGTLYLLSEVLKVESNTMDKLADLILFLSFTVGYLLFNWMSSALFFAVPVKSLEKLTVRKSLRRSWTLSRGSRLKTIFVRLALVFTGWILNLSLSTVLFLIVRWIMLSFGIWWHYYRNIYTGIGFFAAFTASTLTGPIFPIALTLFYYDQRIRHEGYDIERMMEAAGLNATVTTPAEAKVVQA
jgi:hypothetical protein